VARPWSHLWGNRAQVVNNRRGKRMETKTAVSEHFRVASLTSAAAGKCGKIRENQGKTGEQHQEMKPPEAAGMPTDDMPEESHRNAKTYR